MDAISRRQLVQMAMVFAAAFACNCIALIGMLEALAQSAQLAT